MIFPCQTCQTCRDDTPHVDVCIVCGTETDEYATCPRCQEPVAVVLRCTECDGAEDDEPAGLAT